MRTRQIIESGAMLRACVSSVALVPGTSGSLWLRTQARRQVKPCVSSADLKTRVPREGEEVVGCLRVDAISDFILRVRYAEGETLPEHPNPIVIGRPPAPTRCEVWTRPDGAGAVLTIAGGSVEVSFADARLTLRDAQGGIVSRIGGPEENNFRRWDAHNTGLARPLDGTALIALESFSLVPNESIYGLGERFIQLDKVGQTIDLIMDDAIGVISPRAYKNVPFFVSSRGYGVYFNHHSLMTCWVGSMSAISLQVAVAEESLDYYVFLGSIREVLGQYTALTGRSPLPPEWSFGLWQSKSTYVSAAETLEVARQLRAHEIPCDVINVDTAWFERDWLCGLEFGSAFPDPAGWVRELGQLGFKVSLWQTPFLPEGTRLFAEIAAVGGFVRATTGGIYDIGICFSPGFKGVVGAIDFTNPAAVAIYQTYLRRLYKLGVRVIKTDFGEQAPLDGVYHDGTSGERMRNLYPLLYNQAVAAVAQAETGFTFVWSRSAWAGSQRFPVHWGGDSSPLWSNLVPQIAGGLSLGLSGFAFWSHDIGGFFGEKNDETLLLRWLQAGVFCSHSRIHGMGPQELYRFSPEVLRIGREFFRLRYRLLPYVLGEARRATQTGLPLMRALVIEFQDDPNVRRIQDQFLFGESLLVAPIFDPSDRRQVYLPAGVWTDWWTHERLPGSRWIEVNMPLDRIPLYLREGAIVPLAPVVNYVGEKPTTEIEVLVAPLAADGARRFEFVVDGQPATAIYTATGGRHQIKIALPSGTKGTARCLGADIEVVTASP